jgi:hypothetical protein
MRTLDFHFIMTIFFCCTASIRCEVSVYDGPWATCNLVGKEEDEEE